MWAQDPLRRDVLVNLWAAQDALGGDSRRCIASRVRSARLELQGALERMTPTEARLLEEALLGMPDSAWWGALEHQDRHVLAAAVVSGRSADRLSGWFRRHGVGELLRALSRRRRKRWKPLLAPIGEERRCAAGIWAAAAALLRA